MESKKFQLPVCVRGPLMEEKWNRESSYHETDLKVRSDLLVSSTPAAVSGPQEKQDHWISLLVTMTPFSVCS